MEMEQLYDVIVIGGGPAGLTAALYLARARYRVLVVDKEHFGGQITITNEIVNYPGVAKTSGRELTDTMRQQAEGFGAEFLLAEVTAFELDGDVKTVKTGRGEYRCFGVLLATGAHPRMIGFPGEAEFRGRGIAYCATCDGMLYRGKAVPFLTAPGVGRDRHAAHQNSGAERRRQLLHPLVHSLSSLSADFGTFCPKVPPLLMV